MLRVGDTHTDPDHPHFMLVDKKKRQVTLTDPANSLAAAAAVAANNNIQERAPMVAAPKMFAFDSLFTPDDQQVIRMQQDNQDYLFQMIFFLPKFSMTFVLPLCLR